MKKGVIILILLSIIIFSSAMCTIQLPKIQKNCCIVRNISNNVIGCKDYESVNSCISHYSSLGNTEYLSGSCDTKNQCSGLTNCFGYYENEDTTYNINDGGYVCNAQKSYKCELGTLNEYQDCLSMGQVCDYTTGLCGAGNTIISELKLGTSLLDHSCAVLNDGSVKCWGENNYGQLGDGTNTNSNVPISVSGINNAISVATGYFHSCAVLNDGSVKCWGYNINGQLGDGTNTNSNVPISVSGINNAISVATGNSHSCAVLSYGKIMCWGSGMSGQLGDGTNTNSNVPISVSGINNAISVATGTSNTCSVLNDGSVKCWGYNINGQLGDGTNTNSNVPISVSGINNAISVATGNSNTCSVLNDGSVKCWGENNYGQLGDGTNTNSNVPVSVSGINNAISVATGDSHSCAVLNDGSVKCWGYNGMGGLGDGSQLESNVPVSVSGINNAISVATGTYHSCSLLNSNSIKCWGSGMSGQLGDGNFVVRLTPLFDVLINGGCYSGSYICIYNDLYQCNNGIFDTLYQSCESNICNPRGSCDDPSLNLYLNFDKGILEDLSRYNNLATLKNGATIIVDKETNKVLKTDGVDDMVLFSNPLGTDNSLNIEGKNITIGLWVKQSDINNAFYWVIGKINFPSGEPYDVHGIRCSYKYGAELKESCSFETNIAGKHWVVSPSRTVRKDQWTYLVGTLGNGYMRIYVNGLQVNQLANPNSTIARPTNKLSIGRRDLSSEYWSFGGKIDEIRIYNRTLDLTEIQELYSNTCQNFINCYEDLDCRANEKCFNPGTCQAFCSPCGTSNPCSLGTCKAPDTSRSCCHECITNADCTGIGTGTCLYGNLECGACCVRCSSSVGCGGTTPKCKYSGTCKATCVQCLTNTDCTNIGLTTCNTITNTCT